MSIEQTNAYLDALAVLNDGPDHISEYTVCQLRRAPSLSEALSLHFSSLCTSDRNPPQPAELWHIKVEPISSPWRPKLALACEHWFFDQQFSPKGDFSPTGNCRWTRQNVVETFLEYLERSIGHADAFEVKVSPPMFYQCIWQEFAFASNREHWLLHFGFFD